MTLAMTVTGGVTLRVSLITARRYGILSNAFLFSFDDFVGKWVRTS